MIERRFGLATIEAVERGGELEAIFVANPRGIDLNEYSRFKYGDGNAADKLGALLARDFLETHEAGHSHLLITSSAYKTAPPAARALQDSFVTDMVASSEPDTIKTFKIDRANLTNGDYAHMGLEERQRVMADNGLSLPPDLEIEGQDVVILDDISVTGSHEEMLRNLLEPLQPASIQYGYVLSVVNGKEHPGIEAAINASSIKGYEDVAPLLESPNFRPNARFCKFILSQSIEDIERFVASTRAEIVRKVCEYVIGDELEKLPSYTVAAAYLLEMIPAGHSHQAPKELVAQRF